MKKLDRAIVDISNEPVPEGAIEETAARVRQKLFPQIGAATQRLRGCSDYQVLIPSYLNRTLSAGRSLLLQDHTRECPACRRALDEARGGNVRTLARPVTPPSHAVPKWWSAAAAVVVVAGMGGLMVREGFFSSAGPTTVATVRGILYSVSDKAVTPIFAGKEVPLGRRVRTAKDSTATIRLGDGSLVELNERTELSVARSGAGMAIRLNRGNIIAQAAKQRRGTLDVVTPDCTVSVKGTIFAVDRGTKGSRVSVVEGSVQVAEGSAKQLLKPGQQVSTNPSVETTSVADAISWSRDAARYLAALGEFSTIQKGLQSMPSPALRHDPKLLAYVPDRVVLYAAVPNAGPALAEAGRLFRARLQESEVLRQWWDQQQDGPKLQAMLDRLRDFSDYLGDEVVFTVSSDDQGNYTQPMLLAEVMKPGLDVFLNNEIRQWSPNGSKDAPRVVAIEPAPNQRRIGASSRAVRQSGRQSGPMLIGVNEKLLAVTWNQQQLDDLGARAAQPPAQAGSNGLLAQVRGAYERGAGWLLCVNMEQIAANVVNKHVGNDAPKLPAGFDAMRYLIVERKDNGGQIENQATLTFNGNRRGMAGWLADPAPMGSLDFVSPDATLVVSLALGSPQSMIRDILNAMARQDPEFQAHLDKFREETGMRVTPALGEPLGGEIAFAVDGPLLPLPSWKLVVEVYRPEQLQANIEQFVSVVNKQTGCSGCTLTLANEVVNGRTYYTLTSARFTYEIDYTYADGYLIAAPSRALLNTAIQNRSTGYMLTQSEAFRKQLPVNGGMNFSGLVYHNVGSALKPIADQIGNLGGATPAQRQSIAALAANSGPGLIYLYGGQDRLTVASATGFFGLDLNSFALPALLGKGMGAKGPRIQ